MSNKEPWFMVTIRREELDKLHTKIEQLLTEVGKKDHLLKEVRRFLCELEVESDEDSCMGMAFITGRVSEDWYYFLINKTEDI